MERGRGGAEVGREGRDAAAGSGPTGARSPAGRARSLRRTHPALQRRLLQTLSAPSGRPRGAVAPAGTRRAPPGAARWRCRCPAVHRHSSLDLLLCARTPATPQMRSVCFVCPGMRTCACIRLDYSAFFPVLSWGR